MLSRAANDQAPQVTAQRGVTPPTNLAATDRTAPSASTASPAEPARSDRTVPAAPARVPAKVPGDPGFKHRAAKSGTADLARSNTWPGGSPVPVALVGEAGPACNDIAAAAPAVPSPDIDQTDAPSGGPHAINEAPVGCEQNRAAGSATADLPAVQVSAQHEAPGPANSLPVTPSHMLAQSGIAPSTPAASRHPAATPLSGDVAARSPLTPVAQIAPALVRLSSDAGIHRVTVLLSPAELGRVQISVIRDHDGTATVNVSAERPETLALVRADSAQLHAVLDKAGVAAHSRNLQFHLAAPIALPPARAITAQEDTSTRTAATPANFVRAAAGGAAADGQKSPDQGNFADQPFGQGGTYDGQRGPDTGGQPRHEQPGYRHAAGPTTAFGDDAGAFLDAALPGVTVLGLSGRSAIDFTA